jgi:hypothetical protein
VAYPIWTIVYIDPKDPARGHKLQDGDTVPAFLLNPQKDGQVMVLNLGEFVSRIYVSSEPDADSALPHHVQGWATAIGPTIQDVQNAIATLRRRAYAGEITSHSDGWDDPDICRLARAAGKARELSRLLAITGRELGVSATLLEDLDRNPYRLLTTEIGSAAIIEARAVATAHSNSG